MTIQHRGPWLFFGSLLLLVGFFLPWMSITSFSTAQYDKSPTGLEFAGYISPTGPNLNLLGPNPLFVWGIIFVAIVILVSAVEPDNIRVRVTQAVLIMVVSWIYVTNILTSFFQALGANSIQPGDGFVIFQDTPCGNIVFNAHCYYLHGYHPVQASPGIGLFAIGFGIVLVMIGVFTRKAES